MTRLQKAAVLEIIQPLVVAAAFLAIMYFGGDRPARFSFEIATFVYMASLGFLQWRTKKVFGESAKFLSDQEKEITFRADKTALRATWGFLFVAAMSVFGESKTGGSNSGGEYFIFLAVGTILAGQVSRAWAVFHYSDNPEALSKSIPFPG